MIYDRLSIKLFLEYYFYDLCFPVFTKLIVYPLTCTRYIIHKDNFSFIILILGKVGSYTFKMKVTFLLFKVMRHKMSPMVQSHNVL